MVSDLWSCMVVFLFNQKGTKKNKSGMLHGDQSVGLLVPLIFAATADEDSLETIHQAGW